MQQLAIGRQVLGEDGLAVSCVLDGEVLPGVGHSTWYCDLHEELVLLVGGALPLLRSLCHLALVESRGRTALDYSLVAGHQRRRAAPI